jgi:TorA maturation chaperone TorD
MTGGAGVAERAERFALAARIAAYPEKLSLPAWAEGIPELEPYGRCPYEELAGDYLAIFELGGGAEFLAATGFLRDRPFAWGEELGRVSRFYRAFGVEATRGERPDHVAVELEFYAFLLAKELWLEEHGDGAGREIVREARRSFLREFLGPLVLGILKRPRVREHAVFGGVFRWIAGEIEEEAKREGIAIQPLELRLGPEEAEDLTCAAPSGVALSVPEEHPA